MNTKLYRITLAALFAAMIYVATAFLMVPLPGNGYANFGDCFIILGALILGPVYGAAAAGIGSAISDLFLGYVVYAPATLIIKALMAVLAALVFQGIVKTGFRFTFAAAAAAAILAEAVMVFGYFVFECLLYGAAGAAVDIPGNIVQGVVGFIAGTLLFGAMHKTGLLAKIKR